MPENIRKAAWLPVSHLPKCKGPKEAKGVAKFKCDSCEESFLTQRGLSMHELHRHPAIRNLKRHQSGKYQTNQ